MESFVDFELTTGSVQLTLNFYRLNQLRTKHKKDYERYFAIQKANGPSTDLDAVEMIYVAYLCANMDKMPDVLTWEEFLQVTPPSRKAVWQAFNALYTNPKN